LLRSIFRIHRTLPQDLRFLGDKYVLEEFKRHKDLKKGDPYLGGFNKQWNFYLIELKRQQLLNSDGNWGQSLGEEKLKKLSEDQVHTLYELYEETK
ncbi:hypothetical protein CONCODRAFT_29272, partial [Conidiobolus coronatus NRRL 28638]